MNDFQTCAETYRSILKTLYIESKGSGFRLLIIDKQLVSNFKEKDNCFNNVFYFQCTLKSTVVSIFALISISKLI